MTRADETKVWGELRSWCHEVPAKRLPEQLYQMVRGVPSDSRTLMARYVLDHLKGATMREHARCLLICVAASPTSTSEEGLVRAMIPGISVEGILMVRQAADSLHGLQRKWDQPHLRYSLWKIAALMRDPGGAGALYQMSTQSSSVNWEGAMEYLVNEVYAELGDAAASERAMALRDAYPLERADHGGPSPQYRVWCDLIKAREGTLAFFQQAMETVS